MSSSRSVAAARQRRAGDSAPQQQPPARGPQPSIGSRQVFAQQPPQPPQQPQQQRTSYAQYQQGQQGPPQQQVRAGQPQQRVSFAQQQQEQQQQFVGSSPVTLPQMVTLLTLRLASLERGIMRSQQQGLQVSAGNIEGNDTLRLIDETVLISIADRLQNLEDSIFGEDSNNTGISVNDAIVTALNDKVVALQNELMDAKASISKLQLFTMETNQKLLNAVMQQGTPSFTSTSPLADAEEEEEEVTVEDVNEDDEEYSPTTNLKELIQKELENTNA